MINYTIETCSGLLLNGSELKIWSFTFKRIRKLLDSQRELRLGCSKFYRY